MRLQAEQSEVARHRALGDSGFLGHPSARSCGWRSWACCAAPD
jgi:hypothetical protein